jgi:hypothetical protein
MLKKVLMITAMVSMAACASSQKAADSKAATPKTEPTSAAASTETKEKPAVAKKEKKAKEAAKVEKKENAAAVATATPPAGTTECTSGEDKRTIEIKTTDKGCEVMYTKQGNTSSVANGGQQKCEAVVNKIKTNLTGAGFTCS